MVSITIAIDRLTTGRDNFAVWVISAPLPEAVAHHDQPWPEQLTGLWLRWEEIFSGEGGPPFPVAATGEATPAATGGQLMQELGRGLWRWLSAGPIGQSLAVSQGLAAGGGGPLRLRLEIRDRHLSLLPWEIMQSDVSMQPISVSHNILFSRTSSRVAPLAPPRPADSLKILLVTGDDSPTGTGEDLQLEAEVDNILASIRTGNGEPPPGVDVLRRPTAGELLRSLDRGDYNAFFYGGHGEPHPEGGLLKFREGGAITGIELGQALVRNQVPLCVFNACWGARPASVADGIVERSSLAETLMAGGVPAVLAMRDQIADGEAITFIGVLTENLTAGSPIDRAVRHARQNLLTTYRFNQPAWTLPVLYLHPNFDGQIMQSADDRVTAIPEPEKYPPAWLRAPLSGRSWSIEGLTLVGRNGETNKVVSSERWVSGSHGQIVCRRLGAGGGYHFSFIDNSRYGTFIYENGSWRHYNREEIPLVADTQIRLGSLEGETLEFILGEEPPQLNL